jgi:hypothetical protein
LGLPSIVPVAWVLVVSLTKVRFQLIEAGMETVPGWKVRFVPWVLEVPVTRLTLKLPLGTLAICPSNPLLLNGNALIHHMEE